MPRSSWLAGLPLLGSLVLLACPEGPPVHSALDLRAPEGSGVPAAEGSPPEPAPSSAVVERMHQQLELVSRIQRATIAGDLEQARAAGLELGTALDQGEAPPEAWRPILEAMRGELEALEHADDLRATGAAVARLGSGCGRCHQAQGITPTLPELTAPEEVEGFDAAMRGHRWASDRMWEGLVGPSDERWIRGATMFVVLPGCDETMAGASEAWRAQCQHAESLARRGHVARSLEARSTIYGRLLTTCAQCHVTAAEARGERVDQSPA
ncbi:MAG: hypothetical protein H6712_03270 [Myxococcales bacterium]|nr:hypothetical protein [Myxococcales bacterium]